MNLEDILRETIIRAEKIRHACFGASSAAECIMYIKSNNELIMFHENRAIFRTFIPEYFDVHPDITYNHNLIQYDDNKEPILTDLSRLYLDDINNLDYCKKKYDEYISDDVIYNRKIIAQEPDLLITNTSFQKVSNIKVGDGLQYFYVTGENNTVIRIPYFVGLYNIKKADKYGIIVYDFDRSHFLVRITDKKPKLNSIDIFICILKGV